MIQIYINSEKFMVNPNEELKYETILRLSGYPIGHEYTIVDEITGIEYATDSKIIAKNNMSLVIKF